MTLATDLRDRDLYGFDDCPVDDAYRREIQGVLVPASEIQDGVERVAERISAVNRDRRDGEFYPICVLKGAMRFFVDLLRAVDVEGPYSEGVVHSSRYGTGPASETPEVQLFQPNQIAGKHVLLVDEVFDEGNTLSHLVERIEAHDPRSVDVATLFTKDKPRTVDIEPDYQGFYIPDRFVVGYGLDYDERYRDLPHLCVLDTEISES